MVKNFIGGKKQKKKKRVRNNVVEIRKVENIPKPLEKENTYYGKVLKTYGSKFDVDLFYNDENGVQLVKKIEAKVRGSKQMKYKCPRISTAKNPYVIVEYNKNIYKFGTIIWVFKQWEYKYLLESSTIIPRKNDDDADDGFIFKEESNKNIFEKNEEKGVENKLDDDDEIKPLGPEPISNKPFILKKTNDIKKINIDDI